MKAIDFEEFKHSILIQELRLDFCVDYSEKMHGEQHQRLVFWSKEDFETAYFQILPFCVEQQGYIISVSRNNMAITVLVEVD